MRQTFHNFNFFHFFKEINLFPILISLILINSELCFAQKASEINLKLSENTVKGLSFRSSKLINKKTTSSAVLFIAVGDLFEFPTNENQENTSTLNWNVGANFRINDKFYLNFGSRFLFYGTNDKVQLHISLSPELRFADNNFEFFVGFGAAAIINTDNQGGIGFGFLPLIKFNYFINKNIGIGTEINHPTDFLSYNEFIMINICIGMLLRF